MGNTDVIVERIVKQFRERSELGQKKYGCTLETNPLTLKQWIEHAKQEHMDAILYLEKILSILENEDSSISSTTSVGQLFVK